MWHSFTHELAIDGNWIADIEGRAEILWNEDFSSWGVGEIEFRHLKYSSEPGIGLVEWYAMPSHNDPLAKLILPEIRRLIPLINRNTVMERMSEAVAEMKATVADQRYGQQV